MNVQLTELRYKCSDAITEILSAMRHEHDLRPPLERAMMHLLAAQEIARRLDPPGEEPQ